MTSVIIITICSLLLIAYLFDISSARTKIPSVILLLFLGWIVKQATTFLQVKLPDLTTILPILGTIGLILIVLEGSLDLEINSAKKRVINVSFLGAFFSLAALAFILAFTFKYFGGFTLRDSLLNAIPLCVISSAIAIPSVRNIGNGSREFVIYESSLSDIFGVIVFNFVALNEVFNLQSVGHFGLQVLAILVVSVVATIGISLLLSKIEHHIKFIPIIILIVLIYSVSKVYHLPALIFVLIFGIFIGNINKLNGFKWIDRIHPQELEKEIVKFKEITTEAAFLIRALFFLLFGYLIDTSELLNVHTLLWSIGIVIAIIAIRVVQLKVSRLPLKPLLFVAPRGLITILLFLSIDSNLRIQYVNNSLIIQVIILTSLVMMFGLILSKKDSTIS